MAQIGLLLFQLCLCLGLSSSRRHECDRRCVENEPPKRCYFEFVVGVSREYDRRTFLSINGESPGPVVSVCRNDAVVVDVRNLLPPGMETSLHWHGLSESNSPFMDGVPMITQCPILPRTTFRYRLKASKPGTYFYHAHSVAQQLDGIHGPFIVRDAKDQTHQGKTVMISPQMKILQVLDDSYKADLNVTGFRVDVFHDDSLFDDKSSGNEPQRLRIINAAALDCPITLFTHTVPLKIIAADGNPVKPVGASDVIINPGERIDLLVKPEVMKMTHIVGHNLCKGHAKYGFDPGSSDQNNDVVRDGNLNSAEMIRRLEPEKEEKLKKGDVRVFVAFDGVVYPGAKGDVDFRYKLGAVLPYVPSILNEKSVSVLQFHNKSFLYPPSPLLSQPEDIPENIICHSDESSENCEPNQFCECLQIVDLPYNYNVDLFVIDEGKNNNLSQTVHIHGYSFHVLAMKSFDQPISALEVWEKEVTGEIKRNLVSPVKKDTIVVPNKGFVALRLRTNNPGKWLLESTTSKAQTGYGLELILNVENPNKSLSPPEGFPKCGNKKEPDLVFTDD